jgi:hypothetical protein
VAILPLQNLENAFLYYSYPYLSLKPPNMPPRLVESQRAAVVAHLEAQMNPYDIAHTTGVSYNHVMRIRRKSRDLGHHWKACSFRYRAEKDSDG